MIGEFYVEVFVQKEDRFGIKTKELGDSWINGYGECPQVIKREEVNKIPYHEVNKGEKTYYNYGEPKGNMNDSLEELRKQVRFLSEEVKSIREILEPSD
jgi:hypothetical protein